MYYLTPVSSLSTIEIAFFTCSTPPMSQLWIVAFKFRIQFEPLKCHCVCPDCLWQFEVRTLIRYPVWMYTSNKNGKWKEVLLIRHSLIPNQTQNLKAINGKERAVDPAREGH